MKRQLFSPLRLGVWGLISLLIIACPNPAGSPDDPDIPPTVVTISAIPGVTAPVTGASPVTAINETTQYTGTVSWIPTVSGNFAASTIYTATITLTTKAGYTFNGVGTNFFTVAGASSVSNPANSGVVTAVFPATAPAAGEIAWVYQVLSATATVEWEYSGSAYSFEIQRKEIGQPDSTYTTVANPSGSARDWLDSTREGGKAYRYRIRAVSGSQQSSWKRSDVPDYFNYDKFESALLGGWVAEIITDIDGDGFSAVWDASTEDDKGHLVFPKNVNVGGEYLPLQRIFTNAFENKSEILGIDLTQIKTDSDWYFTIDSHAFKECSNLAYIKFNSKPGFEVRINSNTFQECSALTSVQFPEKAEIGYRAFWYCTSLAQITLPSLKCEFYTLGLSFQNCTSLTSVEIPVCCTALPNELFRFCSSLATVTCYATTPPTLGTNVFGDTSPSLSIRVPASSVNAYKAAWSAYESKITGF